MPVTKICFGAIIPATIALKCQVVPHTWFHMLFSSTEQICSVVGVFFTDKLKVELYRLLKMQGSSAVQEEINESQKRVMWRTGASAFLPWRTGASACLPYLGRIGKNVLPTPCSWLEQVVGLADGVTLREIGMQFLKGWDPSTVTNAFMCHQPCHINVLAV